MKKYLITAIVVLLSFARVFAQEEDGKRYEKIRAIRVTYITEHVNMTEEQSAKFWPIYNAYQDEHRANRRGYIQQYMGSHAGATKDQARASLEGNLDYQGKELELKRKYKDRLLQVISAAQLDKLYQAERDFKKVLIEQSRSNN